MLGMVLKSRIDLTKLKCVSKKDSYYVYSYQNLTSPYIDVQITLKQSISILG